MLDEGGEDDGSSAAQPIRRSGGRRACGLRIAASLNGADAVPEIGAFQDAAEQEDFEVEGAGGFAQFVSAFAAESGTGENDAAGWNASGEIRARCR